ncbi:MAG: hypothetical protein FWE25_03235 [Lachnospiraceae bacterium]|nr:hypothetical protein [Lachnospiraceae bacterium]
MKNKKFGRVRVSSDNSVSVQSFDGTSEIALSSNGGGTPVEIPSGFMREVALTENDYSINQEIAWHSRQDEEVGATVHLLSGEPDVWVNAPWDHSTKAVGVAEFLVHCHNTWRTISLPTKVEDVEYLWLNGHVNATTPSTSGNFRWWYNPLEDINIVPFTTTDGFETMLLTGTLNISTNVSVDPIVLKASILYNASFCESSDNTHARFMEAGHFTVGFKTEVISTPTELSHFTMHISQFTLIGSNGDMTQKSGIATSITLNEDLQESDRLIFSLDIPITIQNEWSGIGRDIDLNFGGHFSMPKVGDRITVVSDVPDQDNTDLFGRIVTLKTTAEIEKDKLLLFTNFNIINERYLGVAPYYTVEDFKVLNFSKLIKTGGA